MSKENLILFTDTYKHVIINIPHTSKYIPNFLDFGYTWSDDDKEYNINTLTDLYLNKAVTDFDLPKQVFPFSRFFIDFERFYKNDPMECKGMGYLYTHGISGDKIRDIKYKFLLTAIYKFYHWLFYKKVYKILKKYNKCVIIDLHSYTHKKLKCEVTLSSNRPDICIGINDKPDDNIYKIINKLKNMNFTVELNTPYSGSYIPKQFYNKDKRVKSIMIEINKNLYIDHNNINNYNITIIKNILISIINEL